MKVFLSWSGPRSGELANALKDWIQEMFPGMEIFISLDLHAGEKWADTIAKALVSSKFGIICLTPENIDARWILFEAGALSASEAGAARVIPFLFDMEFRDLSSPLNQFQAVTCDTDGLYSIARTLNHGLPQPASTEKLKLRFDLNWNQFVDAIGTISKGKKLPISIPNGIANQEFYIDFLTRETEAMSSRLQQIRDGYLQIFSKEVERLEDELFDYIIRLGSKTVKAVDLTFNPSLLKTRSRRTVRRREFITAGGSLKRIFLVDDEKLIDREYRDGILANMNADQAIGVIVGARFISELSQGLAQDFILYGDFVVLLEGAQADSNYQRGYSTLYFKEANLRLYEGMFEQLWENKSGESASKIAAELEKYLNTLKSTDEEFSIETFWSTYF
jgi:hypothetical protein